MIYFKYLFATPHLIHRPKKPEKELRKKIETWGLPISEAKAYNKPMFLANLPYAKEACGDYEKVTFFDEKSASDLVKLISEFVEEKHMFQGNASPFDTSNDLHNWKEVFQYILTD